METKLNKGIAAGQGASLIFLAQVISYASGLVFFFFLTHLLPVSQVGVVSALLAFINIASVAGVLGLPYAATKYIGVFVSKGQLGEASSVYRKTVSLGGLFGLVSGLLYTIIIGFLSPFLFGTIEYGYAIPLSAVDLVISVMVWSLQGVLYGLQKFKQIFLGRIVGSLSRTLISATLLLLGFGIPGCLLAWIIGDILIATLYGLYSLSQFSAPKGIPLKMLLTYSIPAGGWDIVQTFSTQIDRILLLVLAGATHLGLYAPAVTLSQALFIIPFSIRGPIFSHLVSSHSKNRSSSITSLYVSRYLFLIYIPLAVCSASFSPLLIMLISGPEYEIAVPSLVLLLLVSTFTCLIPLTEAVILSIGRANTLLSANLMGIIISIIVGFFSIPFFGVIGAALSRSIMNYAILVYEFKKAREITEFKVDRSTFVKSWIAASVMCIPILIGGTVLVTPLLLARVCLGVALFIIVTRYLHTVTESDMLFLSNLLPNKLRTSARRILVILLVSSNENDG